MEFTKEFTTFKKNQNDLREQLDTVAIEAPLEIKLASGTPRHWQSIAITMRTPGDDTDLAQGFLFTEGIIDAAKDITNIRFANTGDTIFLDVDPSINIDFEDLKRNFHATSSCGVCGKASIDHLQQTICYHPLPAFPKIKVDIIPHLVRQLDAKQAIFQQTGGVHAACLFSQSGELLLLKEDVGRHNALDKLIGAALQKEMIPLRENILLVSSRISFELVQKALMAGIPILAAIGAPSSLAIELAETYDMTLIGFLKKNSFNVYCGTERIGY